MLYWLCGKAQNRYLPSVIRLSSSSHKQACAESTLSEIKLHRFTLLILPLNMQKSNLWFHFESEFSVCF